MKRWIIAVFSISAMLYGDTKLAVAANMSYAITPLIAAFQQEHPDAKISYVVGSSGKLAAQIMHGAPYDLYFSANMTYPQRLYDAKMTVTKPVVYAKGALAILSSEQRDFSKGISVLGEPSIEKITVANPLTAPYGTAAVEALKHAGLYDVLKEKFVYGESIAQTITYATKAADIGIIAAPALYAPQMKHYKEGVHWIKVAPSLYRPIDQGMVLLKHAKEDKNAKAFWDFMRSDKAKAILTSYGYSL